MQSEPGDEQPETGTPVGLGFVQGFSGYWEIKKQKAAPQLYGRR